MDEIRNLSDDAVRIFKKLYCKLDFLKDVGNRMFFSGQAAENIEGKK